MKLKIISNGNPWDTKIVNEETGEAIEGVKSITWSLEADSMAEATIVFTKMPAELTVENIKAIEEDHH